MMEQIRSNSQPPGSISARVPSPLLTMIRHGPLRWEPTQGLVLLIGHPAVLRVGLCAVIDRVLAGETVLYLDGANAFDPFFITRLARSCHAIPSRVLRAIHVSRAFTCHQMERLITECLGHAFRTYGARTAILSGLLETFYDEAVPHHEVVRLVDMILMSLAQCIRDGYRVVCVCPPAPAQSKSRGNLLATLQAQAGRVILMEETDEGFSLREDSLGGPRQWRIGHPVFMGL